MALRLLYLALAVWGAVMPMGYFLEWFAANGFDLMGMVDAWHANPATSGLVWDLTIAAIALSVFVIADVVADRRARRAWLGLLAIPATWGIGVSCGLPLFLFLRSLRRG